MKTVKLDTYSKQPNLTVRDTPVPEPRPSEVRVRVAWAAVNPLDALLATGALKPIVGLALPTTLGNEFSGTVDTVGEGVSDFKPGDHVYARTPTARPGAFAEYITVPASSLALVPSSLDLNHAAAVPLGGLTAIQALRDVLHAEAGQTLVITGGSGSFGQIAVPVAAAAGLHVIVTGNAASRGRALAAGAERYLDYRAEPLAGSVRNADFVIDTLGSDHYKEELSVLRKGGTLLSLRGVPNGAFAREQGMPLPKRALFSLAGRKFDRLAENQGKRYRFMFVRDDGAQLRDLTRIIDEREVVPVIDPHGFELKDAQRALEFIATGRPHGKVLLHVNG